MSILVTGGTGKTGAPLVRKLHEAGYTPIIASRSGSAPESMKGVKFDWFDPSTFEKPFFAGSNIEKVYLVPPEATDMLTQMRPFIDLAVSKGVKRFVLLSSTAIPKGGPAHGRVHEYLAGLDGIEIVVLRPSWFFDNFKVQYLLPIRDQDEFVTAAGDGKVPFVSVDDIADAAFDALTHDKPHGELFVVGPDLYSYDQVAELLSKTLGRKITHQKVTHEAKAQSLRNFGLLEGTAEILATLDDYIAGGGEEKIAQAENKRVGKKRYADWFEENKAVWIKAQVMTQAP